MSEADDGAVSTSREDPSTLDTIKSQLREQLPNKWALIGLVTLSILTILSTGISIYQHNASTSGQNCISKTKQAQMVLLGIALFVGVSMFLYGGATFATTRISAKRLSDDDKED
jgi:hypothetical protein